MVFLDTNIFIRLITKDNEEQTKKAVEVFESIVNGNIIGFVEDSVIAEVLHVTVSKRIYGLERSVVVGLLLPLLSIEGVYHNYKPQLSVALEKYAELNLDFVDCLALSYKEAEIVESIASFDKKLLKLAE